MEPGSDSRLTARKTQKRDLYGANYHNTQRSSQRERGVAQSSNTILDQGFCKTTGKVGRQRDVGMRIYTAADVRIALGIH
jgi:hypothetical protein